MGAEQFELSGLRSMKSNGLSVRMRIRLLDEWKKTYRYREISRKFGFSRRQIEDGSYRQQSPMEPSNPVEMILPLILLLTSLLRVSVLIFLLHTEQTLPLFGMPRLMAFLN